MVELNSDCVWSKQGRARLKVCWLMSVDEEARKAVRDRWTKFSVAKTKGRRLSWLSDAGCWMLSAEC